MLKNRLRILLTLIVVFTLSLNIVSAASLIDTQRVTDVYKMSDDTSEFKVPFLRIAQGRIEIDKELSQDGIFISQSGITGNITIYNFIFLFVSLAYILLLLQLEMLLFPELLKKLLLFIVKVKLQ